VFFSFFDGERGRDTPTATNKQERRKRKKNMAESNGPNLVVLVAIALLFLGGAFVFTNTRPDPSAPVFHLLHSIQENTVHLKEQLEAAHKINADFQEKSGKDLMAAAKTRIDAEATLLAQKINNIKDSIVAMIPQQLVCECPDQDMFRAQELHSFFQVRNAALYSIANQEIKKNCPYVEAAELYNLKPEQLQPYGSKGPRLIEFGSKYGIRTMVETGTWYGGTTSECRPHFDQLYTIELSLELYRQVSPSFANSNVKALQGDSSEVLRDVVLPELKGPTIFWLDGHYSSTGTARGSVDSPIYSELMLILTHPLASKFLLVIDDMRLFRGYTPECMLKSSEETQCYPSVADIAEIFCAYQSHHKMSIKVENDAFIAIGGDLQAKK